MPPAPPAPPASPPASPAPPPASPLSMNEDVDDDDEDDDNDNHDELPNQTEDDESLAQLCTQCLHMQSYGVVGEILQSPYYFAPAFVAIGIFIHASVPFVNWHMIWFMMTQAVIMCAFGVVCFSAGIIATSQYEIFADIANLYSKTCHLPKRIQLV